MELHTDTFFPITDKQHDCNFINIYYLVNFLNIQNKADQYRIRFLLSDYFIFCSSFCQRRG